MSAAVPSPQPTASPPASELLVFIAYRQGAREGDGCAQWLNEKLRGRELSLNATRKAVINTYFAPVSPAIHDWTQKWKGDLRTARAMILVCSPGTAARRAGRDWLYDEIDWWIRHRQTAPILLICDHEGDAGTSVVPARILRRWPLIQRVPWRGASDETTLDRLIEGLRLSETGINYEELRRLRLKNRGLLFLTAVAFLLASVIFLLYRDAQRRRLLDVARALALEAPRQIAPEHRTDERASLLAAHAYLLHARHDGDFLPTIDEAIRAVLAAPAYSMVVEDVPWLRFCADGRTLLMIRDRDVFQPGADESRGLILLDTATGLRRDIPFPYDLSSIACNGLAPVRFAYHLLAGGIALMDDEQGRLRRRDVKTATSVALSEDGSLVALASPGSVAVAPFDAVDAALKTQPAPTLAMTVGMSADGTYMAWVDALGGVYGWRWKTQAPQSMGSLPETPGLQRSEAAPRTGTSVDRLSVSRDGHWVAATGWEGPVRVWSSGGEAPRTIDPQCAPVNALDFSFDGSTLAIATACGLRLVPLTARSNPMTMRDGLVTASFNHDGSRIASGGLSVARVWDLTRPNGVSILQPARATDERKAAAVFHLAISPDASALISTAELERKVWALEHGGMRLLRAEPQPAFTRESIFCPDVYSPIQAWTAHDDGSTVYPAALFCIPERAQLVRGGARIEIVDLKRPEVQGRVFGSHYPSDGGSNQVESVSVNASRRWLAAGYSDGTVRLWDLNDPRDEPRTVLVHASRDRRTAALVAFSPDGLTLASAGADGIISLRAIGATPGRPVALIGHEGPIRSIAFSADGSRLISGGDDKTVRIWRLDDPSARPMTLAGSKTGLRSVVFHPDGLSALSLSADGELRQWELRTERLASALCGMVLRNLTRSEWDRFVGADIEYERTCPQWPAGDIGEQRPTTR